MTGTTPELLVRWSDGELNLNGWNTSPAGDFLVEASASDLDFGDIEALRVELRSALLDGLLTRKERDANRKVPLRLRVKAPNGNALAVGETALDLLDGRRCELVWRPPDNVAVPSVFVIIAADLRHEGGRYREEVQERKRYYALTLECLPHAYADAWITVPAVVQGSSIPVTVDDCSSTVGWSVFGGTMSSSAGKLVFTSAGGARGMTATRTGPVDLTTDRRLTVWGDNPTSVRVLSGGTLTTLPFEGVDGSYGVYDATGLADPNIEAVLFVWAVPDAVPTTKTLVDIRKQSAPRSTSSRQQTRAIDVPGSRRTPASLLVESPTTGLETVLVYGGPQYNPAVSRGALHARATTSSNLSGGQSSLDSGETIAFEVPAADFYSGSHVVYVASRPVAAGVSTIGLLGVTVSLRSPSGVTIASTSRSRSLTWAAAEVKVGLMGAVDLPGAELPADSTATVRVELDWTKDASYAPTDDRDLFIDEVLFFNRTLGRLLIANAGGSRKVWVDAANLDRDHDVVFAGTGPKHDASPLSLSSELPAWAGAISLTPGTTHLYVGTTGAPDSTVEATFRPAGNTHMPALTV